MHQRLRTEALSDKWFFAHIVIKPSKAASEFQLAQELEVKNHGAQASNKQAPRPLCSSSQGTGTRQCLPQAMADLVSYMVCLPEPETFWKAYLPPFVNGQRATPTSRSKTGNAPETAARCCRLVRGRQVLTLTNVLASADGQIAGLRNSSTATAIQGVLQTKDTGWIPRQQQLEQALTLTLRSSAGPVRLPRPGCKASSHKRTWHLR